MKVKTRQKMSALVISAIMLIAMVAMVPAAFAAEGVNSVRLYGQGNISAAFPYTDPEAPFDPLNSEAPEKDFMTFNPALLEDRIVVNNVDSLQKVFARQWFVPEYMEPTGKVWTDQELMQSEDIVTEYTYMFVDKNYEPIEATARSPDDGLWTRFWMPIADNDDSQIGIDGYDINNDTIGDMVYLMNVGDFNGDQRKDIRIASRVFQLEIGDELDFLDHKVVIKDVVISGTPAALSLMIDVYYTGNDVPEKIATNQVATILPGQMVRAGRHMVDIGGPTFNQPWLLQAVAVGNSAYVRVGRQIHEGESFFVDGAEYDVARIFGSDGYDGDKVKYITIRNPIPEDEDVDLAQLSVVKESVIPGESLPLLPPFNMEHVMIDDINIPEDYDATHDATYYTTNNSGINDDYDTVAERIIRDIPALDIYFTEKGTESRFHTNLLEILKEIKGEEYWKWLHIHTMPDEYKVFVYPELPDIDGGYGDFLLTSSLRAPNSVYNAEDDGSHSEPQRLMMVYDQTEGLPDIYVDEYTDPNNHLLRLYGEDNLSANFPYIDAEAPFDPLHDEAPEKDFVTFNPAVVKAGIHVNNVDSLQKVFLRQWFVPEYMEPTGETWVSQEKVSSPDVVTEYTYMFVDMDYNPIEGTPQSVDGYSTNMWFPIADNNDSQIGIDGCDVDGDGQDDLVSLTNVGDFNNDTRKDIAIETQNSFRLEIGDTLTFLDHMIELKEYSVVSNTGLVSLVVDVYYTGNDIPELLEGGNTVVDILPGEFMRAGRHMVDVGAPTFNQPWFLQAEATNNVDGAYITVGRKLHTAETFFVDGAEYDVAMIFGSQDDSVKFITIRNPTPENDDVYLNSLSVTKEAVADGELMPMLPPFNRDHMMVDDIGIPEEWDINHTATYYTKDNSGINDSYDTVAERVIDNVPALEIFFTGDYQEERFHTNLLEILSEGPFDTGGEGPEETWQWLHIRTMPDIYKTFVYPDVPNVQGGYGDYLVTSSLLAPNSDYVVPGYSVNHDENLYNDTVLQRFMFAYEPTDGTGIYMDDPITLEDPVDDTPEEFDPMVYDANDDGVIDKSEAITAINDYFGNQITKEDAIAVIMAYFGTAVV